MTLKDLQFNVSINVLFSFIRKGEVDGWKADLTPEMAQQIDEWSNKIIKDNKLLQKYL